MAVWYTSFRGRERVARSANKALGMTVTTSAMWSLANHGPQCLQTWVHGVRAHIRWMTALSPVGAAFIFCNNHNNALDQEASFSARVCGWEMNTSRLCCAEIQRHDARPGRRCLLCAHQWGCSTLLTTPLLHPQKGRALRGRTSAGVNEMTRKNKDSSLNDFS